LAELKRLREKGVISQKEYEQHRQGILKDL
jgi:hypothetical protein